MVSERSFEPQASSVPDGSTRRRAGSSDADLLAAVATVIVAVVTFWLLPEGDVARLVVALAALLVVPGYLLLQVIFVPARPWRVRALHVLFAIGLSPAVVALLALTTALVSSFRTPVLVGVVTLGCLGLAIVAWNRRAPRAQGTEHEEDQVEEAPMAARRAHLSSNASGRRVRAEPPGPA